MTDQAESNSEGKHLARILFWLLVGLLVPVVLVALGSKLFPESRFRNRPMEAVVSAWVLCNLLGGIGCVGLVKNQWLRLFLGLVLGFCFFVVTEILLIMIYEH